MRGAHSIKKKRSGKKIALISLVIILVLAVAGTLSYLFVTGAINPVSPQSSTQESTSGAEVQDADQEARSADAAQSALPDASGNAAANPVQEIYKNERFGFSLDVPTGFVVGSTIDDNAGVVITNSSLHMVVNAYGYNNTQGLGAQDILDSIWNGSEDSIARAEGDRVIVYQYDDEYEYFYWINVGAGSIDCLEIRYPLQDDNRDELDAAQVLMQGFIPGDLSTAH